MPRPALNLTLDMTPDAKRRIMATIGTMSGVYEVKVEPRRSTRSTRQNAYWWSCIVQPFFEFLRDQDPQVVDAEQAHIELKRQILGTQPVKIGNVTCRIVPASRSMSTAKFSDLVDRARAWLSVSVGIETCDPDSTYWISQADRDALKTRGAQSQLPPSETVEPAGVQ